MNERDRIRRILLRVLVDADGAYWDGREWVSGAALADRVAAEIVSDLSETV